MKIQKYLQYGRNELNNVYNSWGQRWLTVGMVRSKLFWNNLAYSIPQKRHETYESNNLISPVWDWSCWSRLV